MIGEWIYNFKKRLFYFFSSALTKGKKRKVGGTGLEPATPSL